MSRKEKHCGMYDAILLMKKYSEPRSLHVKKRFYRSSKFDKLLPSPPLFNSFDVLPENLVSLGDNIDT